MVWYAVRALDEALSQTRTLLLPFELGTWVRLAVITVFAGLSAPQTPTFSWEIPPQAAVETTSEFTGPGFVGPGFSGLEVPAIVLSFVLVAITVGVLFALVGAVMEFVLVDAARSRIVRIAAPFRRRLGAGLRLFGFRLVVVLTVLVAMLGVAVPVGLAVLTGAPVWLLALLVTFPLLVVAGLGAALLLEFTTAFVVPLMTEHGYGVTEGWRRLWPVVRADWEQFAVYVLVKAVLLVGGGFLLGLAGAIVAVPAGLVVLSGGLTPVALAAVAVAMLVAILVIAAVSVPLVTFFRYHSLCTLTASDAPFTLR